MQKHNLSITDFILEKSQKLFFSKHWDQRLIAASILERCLENYAQQMNLQKHNSTFI